MSFLSSLAGSEILIFGAGVTGKPSEEFLQSRGAIVTVVDENVSAEGTRSNLDGLQLSRFAFALVSPGWRVDHPLIAQARDAGLTLRSEIDLAWLVKCEIAPSQRWIGLTGTNGKTTTVQMTESILRESGINARACGNVGDTVIEAVTSAESDVLVLELSSFQLEWSSLFELESAAILNIAEDHLDWHGSFDAYAG
ncbi:MAG: UDP-N-acetylmuramoyl-L-alanine--D-glutamate ligase, partial [Actinobacteria bacterium]|nr:UDP-N-acetylmuramoyl-L-alanine--D-glutamate ligase [Actinomycetota bacterium]